ncbi:MAG: DUF3038 domain-containing protein [Cyanophyceae cyanobacterium]
MGQTTPAFPLWQLPLDQPLETEQLERMKDHLDLIFLSLEALAGISSDAMVQAAHALTLEAIVADRTRLWRLRQYNPWRHGAERKLSVEEMRALVAIAAYLAKDHQELIRRAVSLLEQSVEHNRKPQTFTLLADYLHTFETTYHKQVAASLAREASDQLALKLLIELLFYSSASGHRHLWQTLLARSAATNDL